MNDGQYWCCLANTLASRSWMDIMRKHFELLCRAPLSCVYPLSISCYLAWLDLPDLAPLYLDTASCQRLEVGMFYVYHHTEHIPSYWILVSVPDYLPLWVESLVVRLAKHVHLEHYLYVVSYLSALVFPLCHHASTLYMGCTACACITLIPSTGVIFILMHTSVGQSLWVMYIWCMPCLICVFIPSITMTTEPFTVPLNHDPTTN